MDEQETLRRDQSSLALNPQQLEEYSRVNPDLPALVLRIRESELRRHFVYAVLGLLSGLVAFLSLIGYFVFLVLHGHPQAAAILLTAGVLGLVGGFVRSRL